MKHYAIAALKSIIAQVSKPAMHEAPKMAHVAAKNERLCLPLKTLSDTTSTVDRNDGDGILPAPGLR